MDLEERWLDEGTMSKHTQQEVPSLDKIQTLAEDLLQVVARLVKRCSKMGAESYTALVYLRLLPRFLFRSSKFLESVITLSTKRRGESAAVLARAIYEIILQCGFISKDPENRSAVFMRHAEVAEVDAIIEGTDPRTVKNHPNRAFAKQMEASLRECRGFLADIYSDKAGTKYHPYRWAGRSTTIRGMAKVILKDEEYHKTVYRYFSQQAHSSPVVMQQYPVDLSAEERAGEPSSNTMLSWQALSLSTLAVGGLALFVAETFELQKDAELFRSKYTAIRSVAVPTMADLRLLYARG